MDLKINYKIAPIILLIVIFFSGCTAPVTIENDQIVVHVKKLSIENGTLSGWDSNYEAVLWDNGEIMPIPEPQCKDQILIDFAEFGDNFTYHNSSIIMIRGEKIVKYERIEGEWSKQCEIDRT